MSLQKILRLFDHCIFFALVLILALVAIEARAAILAARVGVTGTTDATTVATISNQTAGPALFVATDPANLGDLSLLTGASTVVGGGVALSQSNGVIIAVPNQFRYGAVGDRDFVETPGELTATVPGSFPTGMWLSTTKVSGSGVEDNFNLAMAYFPFADGWTAGHINGTDGSAFAGNMTGVTVTTQFGTPLSTFGNGHYTLSIAGVDSALTACCSP